MRLLYILMLLPILVFGNIGTVAGVKGKSTIHRYNQSISVKNGVKIKVKDTITTADNSRLQVIMKDNTIITIGENSEYSFDKYTYGNGATPDVSMQFKKGFFRAITGKISKIAPERFHIKTRSSTIGIRGTHFYGVVNGNEERIVCIRGEIVVSTKLRNYRLLAGYSISLRNGVWNIDKTPKGLRDKRVIKAKRHEASKELQDRDILLNNPQEVIDKGVDISSGTTITPPDTPSYDPDIP